MIDTETMMKMAFKMGVTRAYEYGESIPEECVREFYMAAYKAGQEAERAEFAVHAVDITRRAVIEAISKEREACAKLCEANMEIFPDFGEYCKGGINGLTSAAKAIRARGDHGVS